MNAIQLLITGKLGEGKSFRTIAKESGISHVSIIKYHRGSRPQPTEMAVLAKYLGVDFMVLQRGPFMNAAGELAEGGRAGVDSAGTVASESERKELLETLQSLPAYKIKKLLLLLNVLESDD